jgi:alpha-amylase/alpha-mannosidase (GH57 family)
MIMPLANSRDKRTQVLWGIADFKYRFGRDPEGMWLPEAAVDLETLDIMAEQGIRFVILAPGQARRFRKIGERRWKETTSGIDTRVPYRLNLASGRSIAAFFYEGSLSHDLAFGNLLDRGETFAERLLGVLQNSDTPQIAHVALDGETFGHHHPFGDMTLAYCLNYLESRQDVKLTIYAEYLDNFPPESEVQIHINLPGAAFTA